ncbi:MAG: TIGR00645 family protein, partial [Stenotrophomonas sp.]
TPEQMGVAAANIGVARCSMLTADGVLWQTIIHCVFILSAIGIAWTDKLMSSSHDKSDGHGKSAAH